jgi:hypothetical protein
MAQPDVRSQIVQGPLRDVSIQYKNKNYVADRVFPIIENCPPLAKVATYGKGAFFRDEADVRGPGGQAKRGGYPTGWVTIAPTEYAFAKEVTDEDRDVSALAFAPPLKPDQDALEFCSDKIDMSRERRTAATILAQTWIDGTSGGTDAAGAWAAGGSNTFLANIMTGIQAIKGASGFTPNRLLLDLKTFLSLKQEATILDKIKYTQRGVLTADLLAALLELEEVIVGDAIYSTAKEKKDGTDFTAAQIWEKNAGKGMGFLYYAPPAPGLKTPSAGYTCRVPLQGASRRVTTWRENASHQDVYEVAEMTDIIASGTVAGYLWIDTFLT